MAAPVCYAGGSAGRKEDWKLCLKTWKEERTIRLEEGPDGDAGAPNPKCPLSSLSPLHSGAWGLVYGHPPGSPGGPGYSPVSWPCSLPLGPLSTGRPDRAVTWRMVLGQGQCPPGTRIPILVALPTWCPGIRLRCRPHPPATSPGGCAVFPQSAARWQQSAIDLILSRLVAG